MFYMRVADYVTLYRLARQRLRSEADYCAFQFFQGQLLLRFLRQKGIHVEGRYVLDVGCGYGGYSLALQDAHAKLASLDLFPSSFKQLPMVMADGLALPFRQDEFDVVICTSLIEHVRTPHVLLQELYRVTRPGGSMYLSFPPFYSPNGGHQFSPFHYLGEQNAVRLARRFGSWRESNWVQDHYPTDPTSFQAAYGAWGLYPLTISKVEELLDHTPFKMRERSTRLLPVDFSGIAYLREVLTWHVQYLLDKPSISG